MNILFCFLKVTNKITHYLNFKELLYMKGYSIIGLELKSESYVN